MTHSKSESNSTKPMTKGSLSRRRALGVLGAAAAAPFLARLPLQASTARTPRRAVPACVVRPAQTEGPYFLDAKLNRSDIRTDPTNGSVRDGVRLDLEFHVFRVDEAECVPLAGAVVDIWQCDARGIYSGFNDMNGYFDTRGEQFLRGYQVTDNDGVARFTTIYPGWYRGRAVHIHFKIRTDPESNSGREFTSQVYFDDATTDELLDNPAYSDNSQQRIRNDRDGIYRRGGDELTLALERRDDGGFAAAFEVGLLV